MIINCPHSHTELREAIIVNDRAPVVQTGKESNHLGELVIELDGDNQNRLIRMGS